MSIELVLIPIGIATISAAKTFFNKEQKMQEIQTIMKDETLLQEALENYGCAHEKRDEQQLQAVIGKTQLNFVKGENNAFSCLFSREIDEKDAQSFVDAMEAEYRKLIQQKVYERLLAQSSEAGLTLEHEQINDDDAIVLTFQVNRGV